MREAEPNEVDGGQPVSGARRRLLSIAPALAVAPIVGALSPFAIAQPAQGPQLLSSPSTTSPLERKRNVPPGFEALPPIGMGTWLTFDVGDDARGQEQRRLVL